MITLDGSSLEGRLVRLLQECYHRDHDELARRLRPPRGRLERALRALETRGLVARERVAGRTLRDDVRVIERRKRRRVAYRPRATDDDAYR